MVLLFYSTSNGYSQVQYCEKTTYTEVNRLSLTTALGNFLDDLDLTFLQVNNPTVFKH